jgi:rhodanese-related sulfurtransferase
MTITTVLIFLLAGCGLDLDDVRRLTPQESKAALDRGEAVIVDVRTQASFTSLHITGARHIPLAEIAARTNELPRDKLVVTYCS